MKTRRGFALVTALVVMLAGCASPSAPTAVVAPTLISASPTIPVVLPTLTRAIATFTLAPTLTLAPTATPLRVTTPTVASTRMVVVSPAPPTPSVRTPPVAVATLAPSRGPAVQWSETQRGLTAGMAFTPFPVQLGTSTAFSVVLSDASGQPVSDATVELTVTGGMAGMEGEHDKDFQLKLAPRGAGLYAIEASPGSADLVPTGIGLRIQRGGQIWTFAIPKDALSSR